MYKEWYDKESDGLNNDARKPIEIGVVKTTITSGFETLKKLKNVEHRNVNSWINLLNVVGFSGTYK